jgi:hypothetical protein
MKEDKKTTQKLSNSNIFDSENLVNKHPLRKQIADKLAAFSVDKNKRVLEIIAPTGIGKGVCMQGFFAGIKKEDVHRALLVTPKLTLVNEFCNLLKKADVNFENYHTSGMLKSKLLKSNNSERRNMIFCGNTFKSLLDEIETQQVDSILNPTKTERWSTNNEGFFKDYILLFDEYHLLNEPLVDSLQSLLLRNDNVKFVFMSATSFNSLINKFRKLTEVDSLSIGIDKAIEAGIIRPYLVLSSNSTVLLINIKKKKVDVIWDTIQKVVEKEYFGIPIKNQKVIVYVPMNISKELDALIEKSTSKENYYNLVGDGVNTKQKITIFNDKDFRAGIAICYGRLKEGSNNSPNIIINFQQSSLIDLTQKAGRLCRKLEGEEEGKQTFGLFINYGKNFLASTNTSSIDNSAIADFLKDFSIVNSSAIEKEKNSDNRLHSESKTNKPNILINMEDHPFLNETKKPKNETGIKMSSSINKSSIDDELFLDDYPLYSCNTFIEEENMFGNIVFVPDYELNELNNLKNQVIFNEKKAVNYQKKDKKYLDTIKNSILYVQSNRKLVGYQKTFIRDFFYEEVHKGAKYLDSLSNMEKQDASEFLIPVFDAAFSTNQVTEVSKILNEKNEIISERKDFSSILHIPITNDQKPLFSNLILNYQAPESLKDYKNLEGNLVNVKKKCEITIPKNRGELVMHVNRVLYDQTTKGSILMDTDIIFDTLHFNSKKYEVTAFIVNTEKMNIRHYITYIKELGDLWFSYDDNNRKCMNNDQVNKALSQACIVKYATFETELPEKQSGTENFLNECWLNASLAFVNSFTSII